MREQSAAPQEAQVKSCVEQFQELSSLYLEQQEKSVELLRTHAAGPAAELARPCLKAAQQHSAAVAATSAELTNVASLVDAAAACREFLLTTGRLAEANQALNSEIDRTLGSNYRKRQTHRRLPLRRATGGDTLGKRDSRIRADSSQPRR